MIIDPPFPRLQAIEFNVGEGRMKQGILRYRLIQVKPGQTTRRIVSVEGQCIVCMNYIRSGCIPKAEFFV